MTQTEASAPLARQRAGPELLAITIMVIWIVGCVAFYVIQSADGLPASVVRLLSAAYKQ